MFVTADTPEKQHEARSEESAFFAFPPGQTAVGQTYSKSVGSLPPLRDQPNQTDRNDAPDAALRDG